ncbi:clathrin coat assembly protein ap19 [Lichtheimia corymbifera JMRC:FSU:9682]|uniref:Clathrin coat assembly protein ap19 n=1 Tax=Lichtheimia corymbifera JMRC:FSU:9682 TaxID=1263082 RepID=A0A068RQ36_9FUNG|nr:clathrin coat assembly protein ap19 [Lichtheimia corymbifera JMRC:FSU:9682]
MEKVCGYPKVIYISLVQEAVYYFCGCENQYRCRAKPSTQLYKPHPRRNGNKLASSRQPSGQSSVDQMVHYHPSQGKAKDRQGCNTIGTCATSENVQLFGIQRPKDCLSKVCELDLIFNFQKAYFILDELIIAGEMQETSKKSVLRVITQQDQFEDQEVNEQKSG